MEDSTEMSISSNVIIAVGLERTSEPANGGSHRWSLQMVWRVGWWLEARAHSAKANRLLIANLV